MPPCSWDSSQIDFEGRGGDRGLLGIAVCEDIAFKVATYDEADIEFAGFDESNIARQGFSRGLCTVGDRFVAGGSSPSTISLYDFKSKQKIGSVNLTMDMRNAIHGLEPWPYDD
jgi:hypothetical protein